MCRKVEEELREHEGRLVENVEAMWRVMKESMVKFAKEVCGVREVSGSGRKATRWRNEEVKRSVKEKYEAWLSMRRARGRVDENLDNRRAEFRRKKNVAKRVVKENKRRWDERFGRILSENFRRDKKLFWKEVKHVRGKSVKNSTGRMRMVKF